MEDKKAKEMNAEISVVPESSEKGKKPEKASFFHIDRKMLRFKIHFFLSIAAMGTILPYMPVLARNRLELSATSLAAILTTTMFVTVFSKPLIGYIADYFNKLKLIINTLIIINSIIYFLILLIPPIRKTQGTSLSNLLLDWNAESNYSILIIKMAQNCEENSTMFANSKEQVEHINCFSEDHDITCLGQMDSNVLVCFNDDMVGKSIKFQSGINGKCSIVSLEHSDTFVLNKTEQYFNLESSLNSPPSMKINDEFSCKIDFLRDNHPFETPESVIISDFSTVTFWSFAVLMLISSICTSSIFTLADTACCESVQKFGGDFGRQRLFGAVGWGTLAPIGGLLIDLTNDYIAAWILMAVFQVLTLWNLYYMDLVKPHFSQNLLKDVGKVLKNVEFLTFDLAVFFNGMGAGIIWFYLVWFLAGLGASKFLCGFVNYVQCYIGEIPFMFFSGWIIKRVGHFNLMSLSLFAYAVRYLWYSYLQNPWFALLVEIAHGFTYGTFYPAVASYGKLSAKPGTEATTQSILFTTHEGLGAGVGCVLAGMGFDYFGGHQTFFYISLFGFGATLLNILNTFLLGKRAKKVNISSTDE